MTGSWKPLRAQRLGEFALYLCLLVLVFMRASLWVGILVLVATLLPALATVMALRGSVTIGEGWIELADSRRPVRFHRGQAVRQVTRRTRSGQPAAIRLIDENGRGRIFGPQMYPGEAGPAVLAVVQAWFPEVSADVKRALPSHQHPPLTQELDQAG